MHLLSSEQRIPPAPDEIELTVFGLGFGECAVLHVGHGKWLIVDSFRNPEIGRPVSLDYLNALSAVCQTQVFAVLATHWHDDHVRGIAETIQVCVDAEFWCAIALTKREFIATLLAFNSGSSIALGSGARELFTIFKMRADAKSKVPIRYATADRRLYHRVTAKPSPIDIAIWSLSPSDEEYESFLRQIAGMLPGHGETKYRMPSLQSNEAAVVLLIDTVSESIILGADLENGANVHTGWRAVVANLTGRETRSNYVKVPHHGSANAHSDDLWRQIMLSSSISVLTPYARGRKPLPSSDDLTRLRGFTDEIYIAGKSRQLGLRGMDPSVMKTVRDATRNFSRTESRLGFVRCRRSMAAGSPWNVELFGAAQKVS